MRPIWNGHITFGLISIPVALHSAVESSERVAFRLLHRKDHAPIVYKKFCSKEDVEVSGDDVVRGFEVDDDEYAVVEKEDIEEAGREAGATDEIEVLRFVELGALNPLSFDHPYYLAPRKGGEKAYGVLRDALLEARRIGVVRLGLRKKATLAALLPGPRVIGLETLRPYEEIRDPRKVAVPTNPKKSGEVKMARLLIDQLSGEGWDPAEHPNEYRRSLKKLLASRKRFTLSARAEETKKAAGGNVVDLMDALKRSLEQPRARNARGGRRRAGAA